MRFIVIVFCMTVGMIVFSFGLGFEGYDTICRTCWYAHGGTTEGLILYILAGQSLITVGLFIAVVVPLVYVVVCYLRSRFVKKELIE